MPQATSQQDDSDLEGRNGRVDEPRFTLDFNEQLEEESNFGDSSMPLFSMYSKAAEDEDNKMIEKWQEDAQGILIFTGLFSAAVAALLAVTVQDLKPNSQDTSAFYLENIYEVLADPSVPRAPKPPPFSPPAYSVTVNLLWVWSLVLGLICAISATSLQQLARRYIRVTQPASGRCSPEKRARMRAYYYYGVRNTSWVIDGLPVLLHISLFLFFAGLHVYLSNLNHAVFKSVDWAIVLFSALYGFVTLIPIYFVDSPIFTPLSNPVYRLGNAVLIILTLPFTCYIFFYGGALSPRPREFYLRRFSSRFNLMIGGLEKRAEGIVLGRSGKIDLRILRWSIRDLGDDDTLEKLFEAIPGFLNSELVKHERFPRYLLNRYWNALNGLLGRALSSNSVNSHRRIDIGMNALSVLSSCASSHSSIPYDIFVLARGWGRVTLIVTDEDIQHLIRWCTSDHMHTALYAQCVVACILARQPERDDHWIQIASEAFGLSEGDLRDNDSVSLAISIHLVRQSIRSRFYHWDALRAFSDFDILNTLPKLQHDFCMLWNELVPVARQQGYHSRPARILRWSHSHYIDLHRGTNAAPTASSSSTQIFEPVFRHASSYPLCTIAGHLPHSAAHGPAPDITPRPSGPLPSPLPWQSDDLSLFSEPSDPLLPPVPAADLELPDDGPYQTSTGSSTVLLQAGEGGISTGPPSDQTTANEIETSPAFTGHSTHTPN